MGKRLKALLMALVMMVTTVISLNGNYVSARADDGLTVVFHFTKADNNYTNYYMWLWPSDTISDVPMVASANEATVTLNSETAFKITGNMTSLGYIVKNGPDWTGVEKDVEDDRYIDLSSYISGTLHVYLKSGVVEAEIDDSQAVKGLKVTSATADDKKNITVIASQKVEGDILSYFKVTNKETGASVDIENVSLVEENANTGACTYTVTLKEDLDVTGSYELEYAGLTFTIKLPDYYSSEEFENAYTYAGDDLGATWTKDKTSFRAWAPLADSVQVNLYESGNAGANDLIETIAMTQDVNGTWVASKDGDLNGVYYTYTTVVKGNTVETIDPYARTAGVNGNRGMIIDLDSTNPAGWDSDKNPTKSANYTDDVIYELHIRDFSYEKSSGMKNNGKYLAFTETGTVNSYGQSTGIDYLKNLGITHVHLLPTFDYGSVDESNLEKDQFNWGYDPKNFNIPEGSYSTDPSNGEVRVKEFKQMVQALHNADIAVVMDVVYGHVYDSNNFSINLMTPGYYSRPDSNASGCGNDTATERAMNRKFIVDSMVYWAKEYHIDGFRIDQVGMFDTETVNELTEALHEVDPKIILYGEGWNMDSTVLTKSDISLAKQDNAKLTLGFGYFNDKIRDAIKGGVFPADQKMKETGYVTGNFAYLDQILDSLKGMAGWAVDPSQVINYNSCHDNWTLFDKLTLSGGSIGYTREELVKANALSAAVLFASQGVPFMHAGEEILRSKPTGDGEYSDNSYNLASSINSIKWDDLNEAEYSQMYEYYKGLIEFRKAHPALRMTSYSDIIANTEYILDGTQDDDSLLIEYAINGGVNGETSDGILVILNPGKDKQTVTLPDGKWDIYVDAQNAGTKVLGSAISSVEVDGISAMILVKGEKSADTTPETNAGQKSTEAGTLANNESPKTGDSNLAVMFGILVIAASTGIVVLRKKKIN